MFNSFFVKKVLFRRISSFFAILTDTGWTLSRFITVILLLLGIFLISYNTYIASIDAYQSYQLLEIERVNLAELELQHKRLEEELDYYSSLDYKQRYAYDSLGLARPNERIYNIEVESPEIINETYTAEEFIDGEEKNYWWNYWKILILDNLVIY